MEDNSNLNVPIQNKDETLKTSLNSLSRDKDIEDDVNTNNSGLEVLSPTPTSEEIQANIYPSTEENKNEDELNGDENVDKVKEYVDKLDTGKIIEQVGKSGKKRYRVDPDLLIGYTRRNII